LYPAQKRVGGSDPGLTNLNDGRFWMSFSTFLSIFDRILVLARPMSLPRSSLLDLKILEKASQGRECLGLALSRVVSSEEERAYALMSVATYDPYLNPPNWIRQNTQLLSRWIQEKGCSI